jgi:hypothetical protein
MSVLRTSLAKSLQASHENKNMYSVQYGVPWENMLLQLLASNLTCPSGTGLQPRQSCHHEARGKLVLRRSPVQVLWGLLLSVVATFVRIQADAVA